MIGLLFRAQLRFAARAPWSLLVAVLGLVLGTASLVAVHLLTQELVASLDRGIPAHLRLAEAVVSGAELRSADYFELRRRWRDGLWPDVRAMTPVVQGTTTLNGAPVQVVGVDWLALVTLDRPAFQTMSAAGGAAGDVAADRGPSTDGAGGLPLLEGVFVAGAPGWATGDQLRNAQATVRVDGLVASTSMGTATTFVYADIATAVRLLGRNDEQLDLVVLFTGQQPGALRRWLQLLLPGLDAGLEPEVRMTLPADLAALTLRTLRSQLPEQAFGRSILFNLGALSLLALLVAWFLLYQTAVLWLRRQWPMTRLLFYQGVSIRWCFAVFAATLLLLGLAAGCVGLLVGRALAELLLLQTFPAAALELPGLSSNPGLLAKVGLSSLCVPGLAAWLGFRRADFETRQDHDLGRPRDRQRSELWRSARWPLVWALLAAVLSVVLVRNPGSGLFGAFGAILLLCSIGIVAVGPLLAALRLLMYSALGARLLGPRLHLLLGVRDLLRYPADLSAALAALILAVATSVGIATMVDSFRSDFESLLAQRLQADIVLDGTPANLARAAADPELHALTTRLLPRYEARLRIAGEPVEARFVRFDERFAAAYGLADVPAADGMLVNERAARRLGFAVGDETELLGRRVRIAGQYPGYGDATLKLLAALPATVESPAPAEYRYAGRTLVLEQLQLYLKSTVGPAAAQAERLARRYPQLAIGEREAVRQQALAVFDQTFAITRSLTTLSLGVAAIGLYSALVALGLLQAPTQRLLAFLGQSRGERFSFLLGRSLAVSTITSLLALPLGLILAALLCYVVNPRGFGWTVPVAWSPGALLWPLLVAALVALFAGVLSGGRERV